MTKTLSNLITNHNISMIAAIGIGIFVIVTIVFMVISLFHYFIGKKTESPFEDSAFLHNKMSNNIGILFILFSIWCTVIVLYIFFYY